MGLPEPHVPPELSGTYLVKAVWVDADPSAERKIHKVCMAIDQTWRLIRIKFDYLDTQTVRTWSFSNMATVEWSTLEQVTLRYTYFCESWTEEFEPSQARAQVVRGGGIQLLHLTKAEHGWNGYGIFFAESGGTGKIEVATHSEQEAMPSA